MTGYIRSKRGYKQSKASMTSDAAVITEANRVEPQDDLYKKEWYLVSALPPKIIVVYSLQYHLMIIILVHEI